MMIRDCEGLDTIDNLLQHENEDVCQKAETLRNVSVFICVCVWRMESKFTISRVDLED